MSKDTLTITDNRTGKHCEIAITDGAIRAMELRQLRSGPDDFGLLTYDPACHGGGQAWCLPCCLWVDAVRFPDMADLMGRLHFSTSDGRIWLDDQRMLLIHAKALGSLRRELIEALGNDADGGLGDDLADVDELLSPLGGPARHVGGPLRGDREEKPSGGLRLEEEPA